MGIDNQAIPDVAYLSVREQEKAIQDGPPLFDAWTTRVGGAATEKAYPMGVASRDAEVAELQADITKLENGWEDLLNAANAKADKAEHLADIYLEQSQRIKWELTAKADQLAEALTVITNYVATERRIGEDCPLCQAQQADDHENGCGIQYAEAVLAEHQQAGECKCGGEFRDKGMHRVSCPSDTGNNLR